MTLISVEANTGDGVSELDLASFFMYFADDCLNCTELPPRPFSEGMLIVMVFIYKRFIH